MNNKNKNPRQILNIIGLTNAGDDNTLCLISGTDYYNAIVICYRLKL